MSPDIFSTLQTAEATLRPSLISPAHTCRDPVPLFPRRSPQRSSANAVAGGLKPPSAGRLRRAMQPSSTGTAPQSASPPSTNQPTSYAHVHNGCLMFSRPQFWCIAPRPGGCQEPVYQHRLLTGRGSLGLVDGRPVLFGGRLDKRRELLDNSRDPPAATYPIFPPRLPGLCSAAYNRMPR